MEIDTEHLEKYDIAYGVVADVKIADFSNGEGCRISVFMNYCPLNCKGCFNKKLQSRTYGLRDARQNSLNDKDIKFPRMMDDKLIDVIIENLRPSYIEGLTLLGGEPLFNTQYELPLIERVREEFGDTKNIWSWTGFEWEELLGRMKKDSPLSQRQMKFLSLIDTLVDGRYVDSIRQADLKANNNRDIHFRGSSNQRIIDVKKSLATSTIVERVDIYGDEVIVDRTGKDFKKMN